MAWAPNYCTTEELKEYLRIADINDDLELGLAITAASRAIDLFCNRQFGVTEPESRFYSVYKDKGYYLATLDDCPAASGVTVMPDDEITDYRLKPVNAVAKGEPYTYIQFGQGVVPDTTPDTLEIEAVWGWEEVPTEVKQACLIQAGRFFSRRESVQGIQGSPEFGGVGAVSRFLEPDVQVIVRHLKRVWVSE